MAEIPYLVFTDSELAETSDIQERYITNVFWFRDGYCQSIPEDDTTYDPKKASEGFYAWFPFDANGDMDVAWDNTKQIASYMSEEQWNRLGGQNSLFLDISGGLFLKPFVATSADYCHNVDNNFEDDNGATGKITWTGGGTKWVLDRAYVTDDKVWHGGACYVCIGNNSGSGLNEPGVGPDWTTYWTRLTTNSDMPVRTRTSFPPGATNAVVLVLDNKGNSTRTIETDWNGVYSDTSETGEQPSAFVLTLTIIPNQASNLAQSEAKGNRWQVKVRLGEFELILAEDENAKVRIGDVETVFQYSLEAYSSGGRESQRQTKNRTYRFYIYRTFNGVIISSGIRLNERRQSGRNESTRRDVSVFCPKNKDFDWKTVWQGFSNNLPTDVVEGVEFGGLKIPIEDTEYVDFYGADGKMRIDYIKCHGEVQFSPVLYVGLGVHVDYLQKAEIVDGESDADYLSRVDVIPIWCTMRSHLGMTIKKSIVTTGTNEKYVKLRFFVEGDLNGDADADTGVEMIDDDLTTFDTETSTLVPFHKSVQTVFGSSPWLIGFVIRKHREDYHPFAFNTGEFNLVSGGLDSKVVSLNVTTSLDGGTSGSMTIDGTGANGVGGITPPTQAIGGLTIEAYGGYNTVGGTLAKVVCFGYNVQRAMSEEDYEVSFTGREVVLGDIRPGMYDWYDGKNNGETLSELLGFCGFAGDPVDPNSYNFWHDDGNELMVSGLLPSAANPLQEPLMNFQGGTVIGEVIKNIADEDLHWFYVDIDGKAWYVAVQDVNTGEYYTKSKTWAYPDCDVQSIGDTPNFDDLRNKALIMGVPIKYNADTNEVDFLGTKDGFFEGEVHDIVTDPVISWDRTMFQAIPGGFDKGEFEAMRDRIERWATVVYHESQTTIPGNADIRLLDKFETDDYGTFVIISITHDINLESKEWTTSLGLQRGGAYKY